MDFVYVAGPALVAFLFAFFAATTDRKKPLLKLMYTGFSLAAMLVFVNMAQTASIYGEVIPSVETTAYTFVNGTLVNSTTTIAYTTESPLDAGDYDMLWLVVSYAIWLFFVYIILQILNKAIESVWQAWYKRRGGFDDVG